jgi:hypothetical protein
MEGIAHFHQRIQAGKAVFEVIVHAVGGWPVQGAAEKLLEMLGREALAVTGRAGFAGGRPLRPSQTLGQPLP